MTRSDDSITELALKVGFLTVDQLTEIRRLQKVLEKNRVPADITDILIKKDFLTQDQMRLLNLAICHDQIREEDVALGKILGKSGKVNPEKIRKALATQETLWKEGRTFPRLEELLVKMNEFTPQLLEEFRRKNIPGMSTQKLVRPQTTETNSDEMPTVRMPPTAKKSEKLRLSVDQCRVQVKKVPVKKGDKKGPSVSILEIDGLLDGHTYKPFEEFLNRLILNEGLSMLALNCEKLDYVSSSGIGIIASAVKLSRDNQGDFCLYNVPERVKRVINLVGLQSMIRIYDRETSAIASFQHL